MGDPHIAVRVHIRSMGHYAQGSQPHLRQKVESTGDT